MDLDLAGLVEWLGESKELRAAVALALTERLVRWFEGERVKPREGERAVWRGL